MLNKQNTTKDLRNIVTNYVTNRYFEKITEIRPKKSFHERFQTLKIHSKNYVTRKLATANNTQLLFK